MSYICFICEEPIDLKANKIDGHTELDNGVKLHLANSTDYLCWHKICIAFMGNAFYIGQFNPNKEAAKLAKEALKYFKEGVYKWKAIPQEFIYVD